MKKIIKITTPWGHGFLANQIPENLKRNYQFEIDNNCMVCDFWLVWGGLPRNSKFKVAHCSVENVFFMTDEVHEMKLFDDFFLKQFKTVLTGRTDLVHPNIIKIHEFNCWHVNKDYSEVYSRDIIHKERTISVVSSDLTILSGHKKRFAYVNKLIGHFKDRIDVYGRGFNYIEDKWNALAPYKYSVAIENNVVNGYFTEKISECFLANTMPIYYGAPDITSYFNEKGICIIDIDNYKQSINVIEELIETDKYSEKIDFIIENKLKYLEELNLFSALVIFLSESRFLEMGGMKKTVKIYSEKYFTEKTNCKNIIIKKIKNLIK
jgi:hypothetical protein